MYYVYILLSQLDNSRYIGMTQNLKRRLLEHNGGKVRYTNSKKPLKLLWYSVFAEREKAFAFEQYLKSSSGYAFTKKHLVSSPL